ncbi:MAG TPA: hypothetical protein ENJ09_10090 [Planctomycetes bacterium]|nr:hypothetical protein [Planctomycetota bacterium]
MTPARAFRTTSVVSVLLLLCGGLSAAPQAGEAAEHTEAQEETLPPAVTEAQEDPIGEEITPREESGTVAGDAARLPQEAQPSFDGFVNFRTLSRWAEDAGDHDQDLYGVLGMNFSTGGDRPWAGHLLVQGAWGIDSQPADSVFYGVLDSYDDAVDLRLYRAYVDVPTPDAVALAQIGRMAIYDTPETAYFDGARIETTPVGETRFIVGAYGGQSVHLFEGWPSDEWIGGLYTRLRPWVHGLLRVDWMHFNDDLRFGDGNNDLVSANVTHRLGENVRLDGRYTLLDGDGNDMRLKGLWLWPEKDLTVRVTFYRLLDAQQNLAFELNPFFNILNTYYPYEQTQVVVSKGFGETVELYGGWNSRRVSNEDNIGRYNREFDRYYLNAVFPDLLPHHTTWSVTGEVWDSPDNDVQTWGQDFTTVWGDQVKTSFGTYYSLYKYLFDVNDERDNVRTYYAEVRKKVSKALDLKARYEYEDESLDSFHSIRLGVTWRF